MPNLVARPSFAVISGAQVERTLAGRTGQVIDIVEQTYRLHGAGATVNPPSYFLRFPDRPQSRIIALPASLGGENATDGIKWISSFPANVAAGLPRASAVLILNDPITGYPYACLESSVISATRTAASAALAADRLTRERGRPARVGYVGTGLIARYVHDFLAGSGWTFDRVGVHDLSAEHAAGFAAHLDRTGAGPVTTYGTADELIRSSDLIVFATVAGRPYVHDPALFAHNPVVLNVSLRDLDPAILLGSANILDDVDHCLKADTSPHLAEQTAGNRDFITGTLYDVLTGAVPEPAADRPLIFSPFGLGVLDLAVGRFVYERSLAEGAVTVVDDFFADLDRHRGRSERPAAAEVV